MYGSKWREIASFFSSLAGVPRSGTMAATSHSPILASCYCTLDKASKEFERRVGQLDSPKGARTEMILEAIVRIS